MLNIKNLTLLSQKNEKKAGFSFVLLDFFLQPSVAYWLDFNQNFVLYQMKVILGR